MTKDELRVLRSIERLEKRLLDSFSMQKRLIDLSEIEFEQYCIDNGLIYSPR